MGDEVLRLRLLWLYDLLNRAPERSNLPIADVRVNLRGPYTRMPQQLLNKPDIRPLLQ